MSKAQVFAALLLFALASIPISQTQTGDIPSGPKEKVLYSFTGGTDGGYPLGSLVRDSKGNLYGATYHGGSSGVINVGECWQAGGCGTIFKLSKLQNGTWQENVIYNFCPLPACTDGAYPIGGLITDAFGNLYGVTYSGGLYNGGTVFELKSTGNRWTESALYSFCQTYPCPDGLNPASSLLLDAEGNLWGTTTQGGGGTAAVGAGVAFEISSITGGTEDTILYAFCQISFCPDGADPRAGVTFDSSGNIYGTTYVGGLGNCPNTVTCGLVYRLSPPSAEGFWNYETLYDFCPLAGCADGQLPSGGVTFDILGHLFGTASAGGTHGEGVLYELASTSGEWEYSVVHDFCSTSSGSHSCTDGSAPAFNLAIDISNNVYGVAQTGGNGGGVVFEFTPKLRGWQETILHSFCSSTGCADGNGPTGTPIFDPEGNLYGTTGGGGTGNSVGGGGVVYEVVP